METPGKIEEDDGLQLRLERVLVVLTNLETIYPNEKHLIIALTESVKNVINVFISQYPHKNMFGISVNYLFSGKRGAPKFNISKELLQYYVENLFTIPDIATMINVSKSTVKRRMKEYNIRKSELYADITNEDLETAVTNVLKAFPNSGYKKMKGFLLAEGIKVQEVRVRDTMRRVDPEGVLVRTLQSRPVLRRINTVAGPLSLWHIDGNHKLIGYNIFIFF